MTGAGSTWSAWITVEPGRISIDLVTTHTVTVDGSVVPVRAPYTRLIIE